MYFFSNEDVCNFSGQVNYIMSDPYRRELENLWKPGKPDHCLFYAVYCSAQYGSLCSKQRHYSEADAEENAHVSCASLNASFSILLIYSDNYSYFSSFL